MSYTINHIASVLGSSKVFEEDAAIEQLLIDSRKVYFPSTSLFFALHGANKDGHSFIPQLYEKGIRNFVVARDYDSRAFPGANFINVENTLTALQQLAAHHRHEFTGLPVIGITGSNGKTIVKELLFQLLYNDYNIVRSPKSYNSQIGVPLSVWQLNTPNTLAIFEAGISLPGEMASLQHIIDPTMGIFTFIGDAHAEGFSSVEEKVQEKLLLFKNSRLLFYCKDETAIDNGVMAFAKNVNPALQTFTWGRSAGANVQVKDIRKTAEATTIICSHSDEEIEFVIPFSDAASIHNSLTCLCVLLYLKFPACIIAQRMELLRPVEMRLELKEGIRNCSIINDGYSADIDSLSIALDFLQQQQQHSKRTLILSDISQSALSESALYEKIAAIVTEKSLYRFIGIGLQLSEYASLFKNIPHQLFFDSTASFLEQFSAIDFHDETILLKGARVFEFEHISSLLEQKTHQTVLEINLNSLRHNLDVYRQKLSQGVKLMAMVKAFSYGSGSFEIANILQYAGVDYLAVAYADEGIELRKAGIRLPVMVMNVEAETFASLVKYNLEPELYSFNILQAFKKYLEQHRLYNYPVHIKLDTGMHRLGFEERDMDELTSILKETAIFDIRSVFSHLVASDDPAHDEFTHYQARYFHLMALRIAEVTRHPFIKHISNTSAIDRFPQLQLDMVRLGIGLYGVDANPDMQKQLHTVATFKTTISQIRKVKKGESVGYSRRGVVDRDSVIATVRVGYADGYRRSLGNGKGYMLVNGERATVIGNVCMDMTMIDITGIAADEEDEVVVFGEELPVYELAKAADTIAYEILTSISQRVKRVYFSE